MDQRVAAAMVEAIAEAGVSLPGVNGEAATAACFTGQWAERRKSAAIPFQANRLYELLEAGRVDPTEGKFRQALPTDRNVIIQWSTAFQVEIGEPAKDIELLVDRSLSDGQFWLWDDGVPMSMAMSREPIEGVVRLSGVYTPVDKRNRGCAAACVHALSERLRDAGFRCVLYTDLGNPTSNSIYRRIGYRPVAEVLRYRFE
jgi:predicted GNAT family acetyltransferase